MTQIFRQQGEAVPVTTIQSQSCAVLQVKTKDRDGYNAIQLGFAETKDSKLKKPLREKFKQIKVSPKKFIREFPVADPQNYQVGQSIDLGQFNPGDFVDVVATSKGCGFQGGIKRWHWSGGPSGHGSMSHRAPGSIGASAYPSRVLKGHHLPGHMGNRKVTVQNLEVIKVDKENNLLVVKGSVPGHNSCFLIVKKAKKRKPVKKAAEQPKAKAKDKPKAKPKDKKSK